jgi:phosphatidylserine decarboxylase precursor-related protein
MYTTLFFKESPAIAVVLVLLMCVLSQFKFNATVNVLVAVLFGCLYFYRYNTYKGDNIGCSKGKCTDDIIISTNEGKITNISTNDGIIHISTYMDLSNNHTQIYPVNGTVINRYYDKTGKFDIVINQDKCRHNEKKIHTIKTKHGIVTVTQIAGFLPRVIVASEKVPETVKAGQYMGMIKFGSRIDTSFPGDINKLKVKLNDKINIGDVLYTYMKEIR